MTDPAELPDWLHVGADVCEMTNSSHGGGTGRIVTTTVDRVLKRDVVLANGSRYRRDRLIRSGGSTWDPITFLVAPNDRRVHQMRQANRLSNATTPVSKAYYEWRRASGDDKIEAARQLATAASVDPPTVSRLTWRA